MNKLYEQLNRDAAHIRLTPGEKNAMRAAIFGAPSTVAVHRSRYIFMSSVWMRALAAVLIVVFAGSGTAFASQGALPGQPLYAVKTKIVEPVRLALAGSPAAKAAVHVAIAQERVAEAEALAQQGALDATTSEQLAGDFEQHAQSAVALADEASSTDPSAPAEVKTQLAVSSSVGSAVLVALADRGKDRDHVDAVAARVLAVATRDSEGGDAHASVSVVNSSRGASIRTMAIATAESGSTTAPGEADAAVSAESALAGQKAALGLQSKAQTAFNDLKAQYASASSTLSATTTVSVATDIKGIDTLMADGASALDHSLFDTAISDFTQALSRSLRLSALLSAQQRFDSRLIDPIIKSNSASGNRGDAAGRDEVRIEVNN